MDTDCELGLEEICMLKILTVCEHYVFCNYYTTNTTSMSLLIFIMKNLIMHSAEEIVVIVDNKVFIIEHIFPRYTLPLKNLLRPNMYPFLPIKQQAVDYSHYILKHHPMPSSNSHNHHDHQQFIPSSHQ